MKPQLGQSKLAILKHAPTVYRKRRPVDLRNRHGALLGLGGLSNDYSPFPTAQPPGTSPHHHIHTHNYGHNHGHNHTHSRPPPLLRRQSTITRGHKSFMDIDLPSIRALCREPSMMELDPPTTLFAPTPSPAHFLPGPWAFFQAAEAQRAQRQTQVEFLTRLQELRAKDEQCFVQLMAGFAKECPVQFAQLTEFMRRMENELASAAAQEEQQNNQNSFLKNGGAGGPFQQGHQQQQRRYSHTGVGASQDYWGRVQEHRESRGTKMGLLELAQLFGNQVQAQSSHGERFHRDQQQQYLQQLRQQYGGSSSQLIDRRASLGTIETGRGAGNGKGSRHGGRNGRPGGVNGQSRSASMPVLRRGKTFQQQQQAMQQLTAYQRQLYQHVQQVYQQQQQQQQQQQRLGYQSPLGNGSAGFVTSPITIPLTHELMEYAAMTAAMSTGPTCPTHSSNSSSVNNLPALINSLSSSPPSSLSSASPPSSTGSRSPLSPPAYTSLMGQFQQQRQQQQCPPLSLQQQGVGLGEQSYFFQNQDPLELAAINMHMNMNSQGSSRRQRYKPTPVRTL